MSVRASGQETLSCRPRAVALLVDLVPICFCWCQQLLFCWQALDASCSMKPGLLRAAEELAVPLWGSHRHSHQGKHQCGKYGNAELLQEWAFVCQLPATM